MIAPSTLAAAVLVGAAKASVLFAAAFVVTPLLRRASAATRHLVWLAAFGGAIALPVAGALVPDWRIPLLEPRREAGGRVVAPVADRVPVVVDVSRLEARTAAGRTVAPGAAAEVDVVVPFVVPGGGAAAMAPSAAASPWSLRVFLLWLFGFVMVAVAFAVGVLRTHLLACTAADGAGGRIAEEVEVLAASLGIRRDVRLVSWGGPAMPMTWGARRPVVLLPDEARLWPAARRRQVLLHELAHVRRGDWLARVLAALVCAIHWFNPLAWLASRRLREEQELACDDVVLASGARPSDYAAHLLDVARGFRVPAVGLAGSVAMARPSQLSGRLLALLDESRARGAGRRSAPLAWAGALLMVLPLAAATPAPRAAPVIVEPVPSVAEAPADVAWSAPAHAASPDAAVRWGVSDGAPAHASPSPVAAPTDRQQPCEEPRSGRGRGSTHSHSSNTDDGAPRRVQLSVRVGDCILDVQILGEVRFRDDDGDVAELPRDGAVMVAEQRRGTERRFQAAWRDGRIERRWWVDGREAPETEALRAWLAQALQAVFTRTGYHAVAGALRAYRAGGLDSALALSEATGSDYARRVMMVALMDSVAVPPADAARIARQALTMASDYERATLLIAVAGRLRLDGAVQDAMVEAAGTMASDYERRRVLTAALARRDLSDAATTRLLATAARMSSDYEKVELLLAWLSDRPFDERRRAAFFESVNSVGSDYEHRRLLSAVVDRLEAPGATIGEVCASAERIGSDHERAELLVQVMTRFGRDAGARSAVYRATQGIGSSYEKNRVLSLLARP